MAWNEPFVTVDSITITSPQKMLTFTRKYHPGLGDLVVYVNGVYAIPKKDYKEITPYSIEFTEELEADDTVALHYQKMW